MPVDIQSPSLCLGIVGTGAMGRGIAQIAAQAGIRVLLFDALHGAAANARETVVPAHWQAGRKRQDFRRCARRRLARLEVVRNLDQTSRRHRSSSRPMVENLDVKKQLFQQLEDIIGADCILATNTSSLSVTSIAATCKRPERVAGFHFFNPVPLMKIVEVIDGLLTAPWAADALLALGRRMGHTAVRARDTPGFIVNHAGRGFVTEALRILGEGVATSARSTHHARGRRLSHGPLRTDGPHRPRRLAAGDGIDLPPVLPGAALPALAARGAASHRWPARTQDRARLLRLPRWQGRGLARGAPVPPPCPAASGSARPIRNGPTSCASIAAAAGVTVESDLRARRRRAVHRHPAGRRRHHRLRRTGPRPAPHRRPSTACSVGGPARTRAAA
jgi:hypothetical protein